jgi:hypothetical protein
VDPFFVLVFTFVLLLVLLVGSFIVLFPITRRLGAVLERLARERSGVGDLPDGLEAVRAELAELRAEVARLAEQQGFVESLLEERDETRRLGGAGPET